MVQKVPGRGEVEEPIDPRPTAKSKRTAERLGLAAFLLCASAWGQEKTVSDLPTAQDFNAALLKFLAAQK